MPARPLMEIHGAAHVKVTGYLADNAIDARFVRDCGNALWRSGVFVLRRVDFERFCLVAIATSALSWNVLA